VDLDLAQLRALHAAVAGGTLEAAARALHVTPSAVSQRLKALETATGAVLLVRSRPVTPTPAGEAVLRLARQVELLLDETAAELLPDRPAGGGPGSRPPTLPLAVNADSLATWALPALSGLAGEVCFDLHREDEDHTAELLRAGVVAAAVTTRATPVPGCRSVRLGRMRYRPMASPAFAARWFPDGVTRRALASAPVVVFDRKDELQHRYLRRRGPGLDPPVHHVPASADHLRAVAAGFGWGMLPDLQSGPPERAGEVADLDPRRGLDVTLHWQQWRVGSSALDRVAGAVRAEAARQLLP
jgi:LysR family transcriptional regulator (chromosome initiation inhibitor)